MKNRYQLIIPVIPTLFCATTYCSAQKVISNYKPNIIIFYIDDMGYGQPSCYGGELVNTPNIDNLAENGVRFTNGYVSAPISSPSRVGLLTGRYQARTGHDANTGVPGRELEINETTIAQRLKDLGYKTGIVGKWHVGETTLDYLPLARGFDYYFGHAGNINEMRGRQYIDGNISVEFPSHPITSETWAKKSIDFIETNDPGKTGNPFFLYLAFNAVHTPIVAKESTLKQLKHIENIRERTYAGLIMEADDAIGQVMKIIRKMGIEENTLIYCISDNGGAYSLAEMNGLRGRKWYLFEGGIRVPFIIQWKSKIDSGWVSDEPVIQLDVLPTVINAAGGEVNSDWEIDGVNLLPYLIGNDDTINRDALYWRFGSQYAIRKGDWKLVKALEAQKKPILINLKEDKAETTDLFSSYPEIAEELQKKWDDWNSQMKPPRWNDERWDRTE